MFIGGRHSKVVARPPFADAGVPEGATPALREDLMRHHHTGGMYKVHSNIIELCSSVSGLYKDPPFPADVAMCDTGGCANILIKQISSKRLP